MTDAFSRDRLVVAAGLAGLCALAWVYVIRLAADMRAMGATAGMAGMAGMAMAPDPHAWGADNLAMLFVMWAVMMVAMMLPSATPMILMFGAVNRRRAPDAGAFVPTSVFVLGYVVAWSAYSVAAALAQWTLHRAALLSPAMVSTSPVLGGVLLVAAGVFQWTRLKQACLTRCRSPLGFLMTEWRAGRRGALVMGLRHGLFCVGCCWVLMALLFVAGIMNLVWIAALAAFVLVEKLVPGGERVARAAGVLLVLAGVWLLTGMRSIA